MRIVIMGLMELMGPASWAAHLVSQSIDLGPGWNAVYLEVQPVTNDIQSTFQGIPIHSVWTWIPQDEPTEYVQSLSEELTRIVHTF